RPRREREKRRKAKPAGEGKWWRNFHCSSTQIKAGPEDNRQSALLNAAPRSSRHFKHFPSDLVFATSALAEWDGAMTAPQQERRLTTRVHNVWKKVAGSSSFPRRSQIDPTEFGTDWAHCLLIDLDQVPARSRFSYVGNALRDPTW